MAITVAPLSLDMYIFFDNGFLFGTKYRCLASQSVFYRYLFGFDDCLTDFLILQGSVREYLQPFVILALQCCRTFRYNSFSAGSFGDATHGEV
jgi:hypothetical protein